MKSTGRSSIDPADLAAVATALAPVGVEEPRIDTDTGRVSVPVDGGTEQLTAIVRALDEQGLVVDDVGLRRPTLDKVCLAMTRQPFDAAAP